jgi:alcohol dehydrogenase YqhD (iron-dependent ADH family)
MNTIAIATPRANPQPLLAASSRIAAAFGVFVLFTLAWTGAERASREAVLTSTETISRAVVQHATLPSVVVVGRREAVTPKNLSADKAA